MSLHYGVGKGMRGYYAMLHNEEEVIQTGIGSFGNPIEAYEEAMDWARAEGHIGEVYRLATQMMNCKCED